ncbi:phage tail tape measure protein [Pseudoxanthomonas sp. 22568]|uniref:phage tail tape measure protein n=1 Tax=Pseudoxanthomonas sp. 22568 TaxID=3453945 RepID=UPI003F82916E
MNSNLTLAARLQLDSRKWSEGLSRSRADTRGFVAGVKREFAELRGFMASTTGKLAGIGAGVSFANELRRSARMDQALARTGQTADATKGQIAGLRGELHQLAQGTGEAVADLQAGVDVLIASGMRWDEARSTINGVGKAMAVTGAQADTLAGALGVASTAFDFDLAKPGKALELLDKMTVAGRKGNAELENLGSIFSRVGMNARGAGFGFESTLAFIEGLSMIERQPERLATLADSTLRLFTNAKYMKDAQKATGVRFFDNAGGRRDPLVILADMKKIMDGMKTDAQREGFLSRAFGNADLDTIKGLRALLSGSALSKISTFTADIRGATGTIERDLPNAINNAVSASGRLKANLIEAADRFAKPINNAFTRLTDWALRSKEKGGLEMSGGEMALAGGISLAALYAGGRLGKGLLGRLSGGAATLGTGVAMGQALENVGAATPVFVVGAAPGVFGGGAGGGMSPIVAGGTTAAGGRATTTVGGLLRRRLAGAATGLGRFATVATVPLAFAMYGGNAGAEAAAAQQGRGPMPGGFRGWLGDRVNRGAGISATTDFFRQFQAQQGKVDLNINVRDDRVSVSVGGASGVGNVRTSGTSGPSRRYRRGRVMGDS